MTRPDDSGSDFEVLRPDNDRDHDVHPSRDRFDRAASAGRRRRRAKLAALTAGAAIVVIAIGAVVVPTDPAPDRLVLTNTVAAPTTDPTGPLDTAVPPSSAPTESTPSTAHASTTTEPSGAPAPAPQATSVPTTESEAPESPVGSPGDEFITVATDQPAVIDVWDASGAVASFDLPCPSDRRCTVESTRTIGDTIWVALTEAPPGDADVVARSRIVSVSRSTGEMAEHLALDGPAVVRSAGLGADDVLYARVDGADNRERTLVAVDDGQATTLETDVAGFRLSDDGRFLAVSFSDPPTGETARFEISDLVEQTTSGFDTPYINAGPAAWSPDGRFLIVDEQWEDRTAWVIDPWSGSSDPVLGDLRSEPGRVLDGACFMSNSVFAHRTWNVGYGQGNAERGVVRLTSLDTGSTVGELGDDLFGDAFRCHDDGSISYLRRPVIEVEASPGFFQDEPDRNAAVDLVHIAADGTVSVRATGNLRMV